MLGVNSSCTGKGKVKASEADTAEEGGEAGGSWNFLLWGVLPAHLSPSAPRHLTLLGRYGHHFPFGVVVFEAFPILCFTSEELMGSMFAGAGTRLALFPPGPAPLLPVGEKPAGHKALQAHGGAQLTDFQRCLAASPHPSRQPSSWSQILMPGLLRSCFVEL